MRRSRISSKFWMSVHLFNLGSFCFTHAYPSVASWKAVFVIDEPPYININDPRISQGNRSGDRRGVSNGNVTGYFFAKF